MKRLGAGLLTSAVLGVAALASPPASARVQAGTVSCDKVTGVLVFTPALTNDGGATGAVSGKFILHGCSSDSVRLPPKAIGSVRATVQATCTGIAPSVTFLGLQIVVTIWWGLRGIAPTSVAFVGESLITSPTIGFAIGGSGTSASGSFHGPDGGASSTAMVTSALTAQSALSACDSATGLHRLKIAGGTLHVG